ncbi:DNA binding protein with helix-turn-helix domain [Actinoalloteichus hymeniacidonis]|uniref:DNA binding protein with helix-turn-helix domain n=3 Tax=Actinoalloteichus hymeniacidonis TaxID=340345 RepID=A0AAC9HUI8_9PSEU|nr:DNA binding protein with helix-turn-helix domain [Actinoalloteichus hymeniacidonis]
MNIPIWISWHNSPTGGRMQPVRADYALSMAATPKSAALGQALRAAREAQEPRVSASGLSVRLGWSPSTVGRWESGARVPSPVDVATLLTELNVSAALREELVAMATTTGDRHWVAMTIPEQRRALAALLEAERDAREITIVSPLLVPGFCQSAAYARAIMQTGQVPAHEIEPRVRTRVGRRDVLAEDNPPSVQILLGEAALHRLIGGPAILARQLRLLQAIGGSPTVDLRVVPLASPWAPDLEGPYDLHTFEGARPATVHVETRMSAIVLHEPEHVTEYRNAAVTVQAVAMPPRESSEFIGETATRLEQQT